MTRTQTVKFDGKSIGSVAVEVVATYIEGFVEWEAMPGVDYCSLDGVFYCRNELEVLGRAIFENDRCKGRCCIARLQVFLLEVKGLGS